MINIEQKASLGATDVTQIGEQNNYYGISLSDALDLARKVSDEQYLKIKPELIAELNDKFDREFEERFEKALSERTAKDEEVDEMLEEIGLGRKC